VLGESIGVNLGLLDEASKVLMKKVYKLDFFKIKEVCALQNIIKKPGVAVYL
jgi:hypothetical protein